MGVWLLGKIIEFSFITLYYYDDFSLVIDNWICILNG